MLVELEPSSLSIINVPFIVTSIDSFAPLKHALVFNSETGAVSLKILCDVLSEYCPRGSRGNSCVYTLIELSVAMLREFETIHMTLTVT